MEFHRGGADIGVLSWGRRTSIESAHGRPPGAKSFFVPALVIAWTWRFWIFLAALLSALVPFYKTHFFDPSGGNVPVRLCQSVAAGAVEGFVYAVVIWGIAVWIARATQARL